MDFCGAQRPPVRRTGRKSSGAIFAASFAAKVGIFDRAEVVLLSLLANRAARVGSWCCHLRPPSERGGRTNLLSSTVIEFQVFYEPQNPYRHSWRHRRRRTKIHSDARAPPVVRGSLAGRFRPL